MLSTGRDLGSTIVHSLCMGKDWPKVRIHRVYGQVNALTSGLMCLEGQISENLGQGNLDKRHVDRTM